MDEEKISEEERFATTTSYHGWAHIYDGNNGRMTKIIWMILVILATAACISQCIIIIYNASKLPTRMVIRKQLMNTSIFPSVTLCNTNDYDRSALPAADLYHQSALVKAIYGSGDPNKTNAAINYFDKKFGGNFQFENLTRVAGHKLSNMLLSCTWMEQPCYATDFVNIITDGGSCFTFNPGTGNLSLKNETVSGNSNGLRLILNVEQYKYYSGIFALEQPDAGIRFTTHYYKQTPNFISKSYYAPTGFHTYVPITLQHDKRLKKPWGQCGEEILVYNSFYSRDACLSEYAGRLASYICNCTFEPQIASNPCNGTQFLTCITPLASKFRQDLSQNLSICPIACETYSYPTEISQSALAALAFASSLDPLINVSGIIANAKANNWIAPNQSYFAADFIRDNIVYLDIYYSDLHLTQTLQEEDTGFSKIISELGGQLGICIGASALTICEIVQYLIKKCFASNKKSKSDKSSTNTISLGHDKKPFETTTVTNIDL
ncbi:uncharacterized protein TRIADDRAFT_55639 [Trichoplax adhaerens]|uniref:Acid-sensing ion channel 5 n=1 Tax=Trichoplax adhaerens TaxID=10228 RepID=B3RVG1_TRIAD|nr:hypothetical protein TRIADDRAFT_55639 [Trichoplax adhaerens]EDV25989.1 hypothetical protein TRIADDRAFT_55639 [Trichoplax adhaerens]|eukprot:XP_002112022.1 hypothetical protein TRIADDRAFT_55639 [Trichoplax adhaerens]